MATNRKVMFREDTKHGEGKKEHSVRPAEVQTNPDVCDATPMSEEKGDENKITGLY